MTLNFFCRIESLVHGSTSCLGCCTKPAPIIVVDDPSKGLRIQGRTVKKPSISEDFWSTSTCKMDNGAIRSQRLLLWNQTRQQWIGNKFCWNATYDSLIGTNKLFPQPIPLSV
ncbi:hypothetical protein MKW92_026074, partial [Papaver armeniacum]